MNFRLLPLALFALALDLSPTPPAHGETGTVGSAGIVATEQQGAESAPHFHLGMRRQIVQFVMPPVTLEQPIVQPPPLVTLYSDPALRAKYPVNPGAKTIAESLHQTMGELVLFQYALQGPDQDLLTRQSRANALMSLAGRVYFDDQILLSQDLLMKYFEQNGDRFIRSSKVGDCLLVGGQPQFNLSLIIDRDALTSDLAEKRFIFRPALRPLFFSFLDQTVNGAKDDQERGRKALEAVIKDRNQRYADEGVPSMANPDQDVTNAKDSFLLARQAAQRNEVEVAFSGSVVARPSDLQASISDEDWKNNTLEVAVQTNVLPAPVAAHLPVDPLIKQLDQQLAQRKASGEREWWDIGSIQASVPLSTMVLTDADRKKLEESGVQPTTIVPVSRIGMKRNYYKPFFYTSVRMKLTLVRIDNGEIIGENMAEKSDGAETRDQSVQAAVQQAATGSANKLIDKFLAVWPKEVGGKADFKMLLTSVTPDQIDSLTDSIEGSATGAKVYLRSLIGSTAVLTVDFPQGIERLKQVIDGFNYPKLRLVAQQGKGLEYMKVDSAEAQTISANTSAASEPTSRTSGL